MDRETRRGSSTWIVDSDDILDKWVILVQAEKEAEWRFSPQTHLSHFLLFMETCKGGTADFWAQISCPCQILTPWLIFLDDWGPGLFPRSLYSSPLSSRRTPRPFSLVRRCWFTNNWPFWRGLDLHRPSFLSMWHDRCGSDLYATQIQQFYLFLILEMAGLSYSIYLVRKYVSFHFNKFSFNQSVTQKWLQGALVRNDNKANILGNTVYVNISQWKTAESICQL